MIRVIKFQILIIGVCMLMSCQLLNSGDVEKVAQVTAGSQDYVPTDSTSIDLTIKNLSNSPIYFNGCGSRTIEELKNKKVTQSVDFVNPCMCNCIATIKSKEEKGLYISGYLINRHKNNLKLTEEFNYKIYPHLYRDKQQEKKVSMKAIKAEQFNLISP